MRTYVDHMCFGLAHLIAFICRVITLMKHEKIRVIPNKDTGLARVS